jgi:hypothetical protein
MKLIVDITEGQKKHITKEFLKDSISRLSAVNPAYYDEEEYQENLANYLSVLKDLTTKQEYDTFMAEL